MPRFEGRVAGTDLTTSQPSLLARDTELLSRAPKAGADELTEAFSDPTERGIVCRIG